jgi:hypothetical protein
MQYACMYARWDVQYVHLGRCRLITVSPPGGSRMSLKLTFPSPLRDMLLTCGAALQSALLAMALWSTRSAARSVLGGAPHLAGLSMWCTAEFALEADKRCLAMSAAVSTLVVFESKHTSPCTRHVGMHQLWGYPDMLAGQGLHCVCCVPTELHALGDQGAPTRLCEQGAPTSFLTRPACV